MIGSTFRLVTCREHKTIIHPPLLLLFLLSPSLHLVRVLGDEFTQFMPKLVLGFAHPGDEAVLDEKEREKMERVAER